MELPSLSVDLVQYSTQLLRLLHAADVWPLGGLYKGLYAYEAARRYVSIWLPLMASCRDDEDRQKLIPPLDIQFVWLVHRLSPISYQCDTKALNGGEPMNALPSSDPLLGPFSFTDGLVSDSSNPWVHHTIKRWEDVAGPSEPFFPPRPLAELEKDGRLQDPGLMLSGISFDLLGSLGRQAGFLHSCLRPWYLERPFLEHAQHRYRKFWHLFQSQRVAVVPMLDTDLMWHTHMGCSAAYVSDCKRAFNKIFNHDDGIVEDKLSGSFQDTTSLYSSLFPGELYNPPPTWLVNPVARHPLEYIVGPALMQLFQRPMARSAPEEVKALSANIDKSPRAGGDALYLMWMLSQETDRTLKSIKSKMRQIVSTLAFSGRDMSDEERRRVVGRVIKKGLGFASFKNLPFSMSHEYWQMFRVRDSSSWGILDHNLFLYHRQAQDPTSPPPFFCPGCGLVPCHCETRGYSPYEVALFDFLLPISIMIWNSLGGAYPNDPLGSRHVADIIASKAASCTGAANGLALLAACKDWPGITVGEIVCSDEEIKARWKLEDGSVSHDA